MTLNAGLGDIVGGSLKQFADSMTEKLTGTLHADGMGYWILMHRRNDNGFFAYKITANGLDTVPAVSHAGSPHPHAAATGGQMKISHAGDRIGLCTMRLSAGPDEPSIVQLFHFDNSTGEVTYWVDLPDHLRTYGCELSPDGCMFYVAGMDSMEHYIDQYQLCIEGGDTAAIRDSRTRIYQFTSTSQTARPLAMATAPDGRIYIMHQSSKLAAVNAPDLPGNACDLVWEAFDMVTASTGWSHCNQIKNYHDSQLVTSIQAKDLPEPFSISPNPARNTTWLHLPQDLRASKVTITDAVGRLVGVAPTSSFRVQPLDISGYQPGLYVLTVHDPHGSVGQQRLVVE